MSATSDRGIDDRVADGADLDVFARDSGFSVDAVESLRRSLVRGNGRMAQFDHREFGGAGQWMQGGMLMIADPADTGLKHRIAKLCDALAGWVAHDPVASRPSQSQSQSRSQSQSQAQSQSQIRTAGSANEDRPRDTPEASFVERRGQARFEGLATTSTWYPVSLGSPDGSGSQDGMRYAWFGDARRLAIDDRGVVTLYDTGEHRIGGASQSQGDGRRVSFMSQFGEVDLARLARARDERTGCANVAPTDSTARSAAASLDSSAVPAPSAAPVHRDAPPRDPFDALERLADLHARGIVDDVEFSRKKAELLERI